MADIVVADLGGQGWLVVGEEYIDQLLYNSLPPHLTIEVVACESKSDLDALCREREGASDPDSLWMIHPGIVQRARGHAGNAMVLRFGAWSASLDQEASATLEAAAAGLTSRPDELLLLVLHVAGGAPPMAAELARLRAGLIEARLAELGVPGTRVVRDVTVPTETAAADEVHLVFRPR